MAGVSQVTSRVKVKLFSSFVVMRKFADMNLRLDAGDNQFIPNPIDFIPNDPVNDPYSTGNSIFENLKGVLYVVCQIIVVLLCVLLLAAAYAIYHEAQLNQQNYVSPSECFKLQRQINEMKRKIDLLEKQHFVFTRWRHNFLLALRQELRKNIETAIELYDADKTGQVDFALGTDGGTVVSILDTVPRIHPKGFSIMGLININQFSDPQSVLEPGSYPGQCFAFQGAEGKIRIRLRRRIKVTMVTLEHVNRNLLEDLGSAPKDFEVFGLESGEDEEGRTLGRFHYDLKGKALQTFKTDDINNGYEYVELRILSNYGNSNYTCIYRFRVHGVPLD